jgi:hypothetical protein
VFNFTIPRGDTGAAGASGGSSTAWRYRAKTNATSGYPTNGHLLWNNATQTSATEILVSHLDDEGTDVELLLSFFAQDQKIFIQNRDDSSQNQVWEISGTPTVTGANTSTAYYTFPVTLVSSAGAAFTNNHSILFGSIAASVNAVTSATTSDGTANLSIADLEVVGGEIYTDGDYSQIYTQGTDAHIFTLGSGAEIFTEGELAQIYTTGASAQIYTAGAGATIGTQGANATIYTQGSNATISTAGSAAHIQTSHASAAVKSTNFAAVESGGASLVDGSMQPCLTWSAGGRNLTIPSGTATTFNTTSYTYGTGSAAAHRTALGLTTLATTTPAANVANFLEFPTSANLASALTDENGTGGGFVRAEGATLTTPTFTGSAARANGQNAVPATDDEIIVRQRSAKESFYSIGTVRNIVYPPSFGTSGTGSATAITDAGSRLFSLNSGTANSGWARATLARGVSAAPNITGTGINYNKKLGISIAFTTAKSNFTNTGNVTRIVFGTNQTATADGVDPLSGLGFGIEFKANGSSHDIRVFGHNGSSINYSAWVNSGCPNSVASGVHTLGVESDGAGNIFGFFAVNSSRTLVTVTGTGGPTGTGTSANSYVDVQSSNSASSTTSQFVIGFDAKIYVE